MTTTAMTVTTSIGALRRRHRYLAVCLTAVQEATAYRFTAVFVALLGFFWAFILYFLWDAAYAGAATIGGYTWPQMRTHIVIAFGINSLIGWNVAGPMQQAVRTGDIVLEMVRPTNYCAAQIARYLGYSAVEGGVALVFTVLIGAIFLGLQPPASPTTGVFFVIALIGSFLTRALFLFLCSLLTFYVLGNGGIMWAQQAVTLVFSGAIVPIALMPAWLQLVTNVLCCGSGVSTAALSPALPRRERAAKTLPVVGDVKKLLNAEAFQWIDNSAAGGQPVGQYRYALCCGANGEKVRQKNHFLRC